tara:strand:+ start:2462 stop:3064 length:603 start_codon:yes stop_codon:yes gene_type:complete
MSFRIEEKLLINNLQIFEFKDFLFSRNAKILYPNRIIKSLYFDNSSGDMYRDSIEGSTPRKKIRVRNYPNNKNNSLYFEIKISSIEGRFKTSKTIQEKEFEQFKKVGFFDKKYGVCRPQIYVSYDREYFQLDDVRIVIDQNINYLDFRGYKIEKEIDSIVEIKTEFTKNRDDLINDFPFQRIRFSKYCNGYNKLYNKNHK